jgi:hypothetical protein
VVRLMGVGVVEVSTRIGSITGWRYAALGYWLIDDGGGGSKENAEDVDRM